MNALKALRLRNKNAKKIKKKKNKTQENILSKIANEKRRAIVPSARFQFLFDLCQYQTLAILLSIIQRKILSERGIHSNIQTKGSVNTFRRKKKIVI